MQPPLTGVHCRAALRRDDLQKFLGGEFLTCAGPLGSAASYLSLAVTCPKLLSRPSSVTPPVRRGRSCRSRGSYAGLRRRIMVVSGYLGQATQRYPEAYRNVPCGHRPFSPIRIDRFILSRT